MEIVYVPIIVISAYLVGEIYKLIFKNNDAAYKFIPILTTVVGGLLGLLIYFTAPELISCSNAYEALLVGFVSGAGSTGANQIIKQVFQSSPNEDEEESKDE